MLDMTKIKLTDDKIELDDGTVLYRIQALVDIPSQGVKAGDLGGYVQSLKLANGLDRIKDDAWVGGDAQVYNNARVYEDARVSGNARVYGNAWVGGDARVGGDAWVEGNARVYGNARVGGSAWVWGNARVFGQDKFTSGVITQDNDSLKNSKLGRLVYE